MKSLTQTLTEVYEGFKLRKEKKRLEEFVDSIGGFTLMCSIPPYPPWDKRSSEYKLKGSSPNENGETGSIKIFGGGRKSSTYENRL